MSFEPLARAPSAEMAFLLDVSRLDDGRVVVNPCTCPCCLADEIQEDGSEQAAAVDEAEARGSGDPIGRTDTWSSEGEGDEPLERQFSETTERGLAYAEGLDAGIGAKTRKTKNRPPKSKRGKKLYAKPIGHLHDAANASWPAPGAHAHRSGLPGRALADVLAFWLGGTLGGTLRLHHPGRA